MNSWSSCVSMQADNSERTFLLFWCILPLPFILYSFWIFFFLIFKLYPTCIWSSHGKCVSCMYLSTTQMAASCLGRVIRDSRPTEHWGWSLVAPSPPPGCEGLATGLSLHTHCHFLQPHPILFLPPPSSPSSSPPIAPPQAVGTLVQRFFSRKERSMFWQQADTGKLITSNPSSVLLVDMKQMSSWLAVLWDVNSPMKIVGSRGALLTREVTENVRLNA